MANIKEYQTVLLSSLCNLFNVYGTYTNALQILLTIKDDQIRLLENLINDGKASERRMKKIVKKNR